MKQIRSFILYPIHLYTSSAWDHRSLNAKLTISCQRKWEESVPRAGFSFLNINSPLWLVWPPKTLKLLFWVRCLEWPRGKAASTACVTDYWGELVRLVLASPAAPCCARSESPFSQSNLDRTKQRSSECQEAQIMDLLIERGNAYCWVVKGAEGEAQGLMMDVKWDIDLQC